MLKIKFGQDGFSSIGAKRGVLFLALFTILLSACGVEKGEATPTEVGSGVTAVVNSNVNAKTPSAKSLACFYDRDLGCLTVVIGSPEQVTGSTNATATIEFITPPVTTMPNNGVSNSTALPSLLPGATASDFAISSPSAITTGKIIQIFKLTGTKKLNNPGTVIPGQKIDPAEYYNPHGVAIDSKGFVYVADTGNNQIKKLDPQHRLVAVWGREGTGYFDHPLKIKLEEPMSIVIDKKDALYIFDKGTGQIIKLDTEGNLLTSWGQNGKKEDNFSPGSAGGLAVDTENNIYSVEIAHCQIFKFNEEGNLLQKWGRDNCFDDKGSTGNSLGSISPSNANIINTGKMRVSGTSPDLILPEGVAVDSQGNIYVVGRSSPEIKKFDRSGRFIKAVGNGPGQGDGQIFLPEALTLDAQGNIYLCDAGNKRIEKFAPDGRFLLWWSVEQIGEEHGAEPDGIAVNKQGNVYVTIKNNSGLLIYQQR